MSTPDAPPPQPLPFPQSDIDHARKRFRVWLVVTLATCLLYPLAFGVIALAFGTSPDVGQGFYLIYFWFLLTPFVFAFGVVTLIYGIKYAEVRGKIR